MQSCRVCGSSSFTPFVVKNEFNLERCENCGLVQVTDDLSRISLTDSHDEAYFNRVFGWLQNEGKGRQREYEKFHFRLSEIEKFKPSKGTILDVGCSFGFFLDVARSRGWRSVGLEISEYAARIAQTELSLEVHVSELKEARLPPNNFDVITLWNVIEHLDDPLADFRHLNSLLASDGLLVFTAADLGSFVARIQGWRWRMFAPPAHLANFDWRSVRTLLQRTGFTVLYRTVALPREPLLKKFHLIGLVRKLGISDKMMIFAEKRPRSAMRLSSCGEGWS